MQRLADVDVAEPGHHLLVRQRGLEARLLAAAGLRKKPGVELVAERLGADLLHQRVVGELGARHQQHEAEAARIVEGDAGAGRHVKHDVVVRPVVRARMVEVARRLVALPLGHPERAGHAEMHQQHVAGGEVGEQVFRPPPEPGDAAPLQPLDELPGQRPAQVGAARLDPHEARALHHGLQPAPDGLDFGQLGHAA